MEAPRPQTSSAAPYWILGPPPALRSKTGRCTTGQRGQGTLKGYTYELRRNSAYHRSMSGSGYSRSPPPAKYQSTHSRSVPNQPIHFQLPQNRNHPAWAAGCGLFAWPAHPNEFDQIFDANIGERLDTVDPDLVADTKKPTGKAAKSDRRSLCKRFVSYHGITRAHSALLRTERLDQS